MDPDSSTSSPATRHPSRIARRREADTGPVATISSLFADDVPPSTPAPGVPQAPPPTAGRSGRDAVLPGLLAAAVVLALVATVGVGVLWSANRKLAAEVDAALAQTAATRQQLADLRATTPDAGTVDMLADRVQDVEAWTGLPADGQGGVDDLQTRLTEVVGDTDRLQNDVRDGLADVRASVAALQGAVAGAADAPTTADLDDLQARLDALSADVATLCWALPYQDEVAATC